MTTWKLDGGNYLITGEAARSLERFYEEYNTANGEKTPEARHEAHARCAHRLRQGLSPVERLETR